MVLVDEGLEILDEDACWCLLETRSVGRVGVTVGDAPAIFPVNYRVVNGSVVFATGPGLKLTAVHSGRLLAFEVDNIDEQSRGGWSVLVRGAASELDEPTRQLCAAMDPWAGGDRSHLVCIAADFVSGRRIVHED